MRIRLLLWPALAIAFLVAGGVTAALATSGAAHWVWLTGVIVLGAPLVIRTMRGVLRGQLATDVVATLSIVGAIALGQPLAGLVIVLMQTGGEALEQYAERRASAAVRRLEEAAPRVAHRIRGETVTDVAATSVEIDDRLLIRPGDLIPCDGVITDGESELDTSSLTGEAIPVHASSGTRVMSGTFNGLGSLRMRVTAPAARSQYARIVELVRSAQSSKAPLQRLADRYAVWFTPITIALCAITLAVTRDWMRVLAILVVATPCPLILATPVAIIGGINRAARRFVIIRHGGALERLGEVTTAIFDKTGTITMGKPRLHDVRVASGFDRDTVLRFAGTLEEHSSHLLGRVLVDAVKERDESLLTSGRYVEVPGQGVTGTVDGHAVRVGSKALVVSASADGARAAAELEDGDGALRAYMSIDGRLAAVFEFADELRPELPHVLASLKQSGVRRVALLSGDHGEVAEAFGSRAGIGDVHGDLLPADKVRFIEQQSAAGAVVMMVGDGINDAPALAAADVGVALAAHGEGITAEAADVIILVDSLDRVSEAVDIGRRTMRIARQSIVVGLGLSAIAMIFAAFGAIRPIVGAGIQEVIDVAVILNALRTAGGGIHGRTGERAP
jgi:heavy metal translocating P-type ATPase